MNKLDLFSLRNKNLQKLEKAFVIHRNVVCFGLNESITHYLQKARICYSLLELGKHFVTEARFRNKLARADIYVLDNDVAIEVTNSEKEENIYSKELYYPCSIVSVGVLVPVDKEFVEKLIN